MPQRMSRVAWLQIKTVGFVIGCGGAKDRGGRGRRGGWEGRGLR